MKTLCVEKTTNLGVFVLLKASTNHCVQASWRWQITLWIWGNKKTGILNSMFNLPTVCWCVCVWVLVVFSTLTYSCSSRFLMIDYINDFGYDLNPPRYKWLWNERWFVTRKGSIEPQRCIDFFTKWIYLELRNPLLTFLGSKNKRKHSNSAWVTTDTLLSIHLQRKTSVFRKALCKRWRSMFAKTEDYFGTLEEEFLFCSFCEGMCLETRSLCSKNRF